MIWVRFGCFFFYVSKCVFVTWKPEKTNMETPRMEVGKICFLFIRFHC